MWAVGLLVLSPKLPLQPDVLCGYCSGFGISVVYNPLCAHQTLGNTRLGAGKVCLPPNVSKAIRPMQTVCYCTELLGKH